MFEAVQRLTRQLRPETLIGIAGAVVVITAIAGKSAGLALKLPPLGVRQQGDPFASAFGLHGSSYWPVFSYV